MPVNSKWFKDTLADRKISQRKLARLMAMDPGAANRMIHGDRKIQIDEAVKLASILSVPLNDVLMAAGIQALPSRGGGTIPSILQRLMKHAVAYALHRSEQGDIVGARKIMGDVDSAMTLLDMGTDRSAGP
jgi:transcriptional regulator with XRE-family HTH domain